MVQTKRSSLEGRKQTKCSLSDTPFNSVGTTLKLEDLSLMNPSKVLWKFYGMERNCQSSGKLRFDEIDTSFFYNVYWSNKMSRATDWQRKRQRKGMIGHGSEFDC